VREYDLVGMLENLTIFEELNLLYILSYIHPSIQSIILRAEMVNIEMGWKENEHKMEGVGK